MKKGTKIALIIAAVCILVGGSLTVYGLSRVNFKLSELDTFVYTQKTYTFTEDITSLKVEDVASDIVLVYGDTDVWKVTCWDSEQMPHKVVLKNGTLSIEYEDEDDTWYNHIGLHFGSFKKQTTVITMPRSAADEGISLDELSLETVSGNITVPRLTAADLELETVSGEIQINDVTAAELDVESVSGDVRFQSLNVQVFEISTISGDVEGSLSHPVDFRVSTVSGDIEVPATVSSAASSIDTVSGDITVRLE